ncbi:hypothetical protein [Clostridium butyricum]|uniref:hypothetical protein n=1 Tax=Clostridium butyricum TaxID=1492 RepID=UPI0005443E9A|nr:hypothetical protein [Clostridium butyricum]KHD13429.1 hypothetical protein OA81_20955 [Clostridium butyricum]
MIKPNNYEEVKVFEAYEALEVGPHECTIVQMQEVQSQNGKPMLAILLDTAKSDKQPNYYKENMIVMIDLIKMGMCSENNA